VLGLGIRRESLHGEPLAMTAIMRTGLLFCALMLLPGTAIAQTAMTPFAQKGDWVVDDTGKQICQLADDMVNCHHGAQKGQQCWFHAITFCTNWQIAPFKGRPDPGEGHWIKFFNDGHVPQINIENKGWLPN